MLLLKLDLKIEQLILIGFLVPKNKPLNRSGYRFP